MKEIIFLLVLFVANVIQAITGFAGTVLAMPPSMYLLGMDDAKVVLNVMALLSGLMIAVMSYHHMNKKELAKICVFMVVGMEIGIQICKAVPSEKFLLVLYGIIIILIAGKNLLYHREHTLPKGVLLVVLLLAGVIHGMFVSGGALLVVYATQVLKDKEEFRATIAMIWLTTGCYMTGTQIMLGNFNTHVIMLLIVGVVPVFVGTFIGTKLVKKIPQDVFMKLTYVLLLLSGAMAIV